MKLTAAKNHLILLPFSALDKSGLPAIYEPLTEWVEWVIEYDEINSS